MLSAVALVGWLPEPGKVQPVGLVPARSGLEVDPRSERNCRSRAPIDSGESRQPPDVRPLPSGLTADPVQHHVDVGGAMGWRHGLSSHLYPPSPRGE